MKLRYYLRGLGIGIIVTAILMGATGGGKQNMTDEEVKARAAELGMMESTTLSSVEPPPEDTAKPEATEAPEMATPKADAQVTPDTENTPKAAAQITPDTANTPEVTAQEPTQSAEPTITAAQLPTDTPLPTQAPTVTDIPEPTVTPVPTQDLQDHQPAENVQTVVIVIHSGDSSVTVSRAVAAAGLAESSADFDEYLCANGYDKRLAVGSHEIPMDADYEEIAAILISRGK